MLNRENQTSVSNSRGEGSVRSFLETSNSENRFIFDSMEK